MRYVIIGGGIAGISAAKAIRNCKIDAEITMLSAEKNPPYYRPMIPTVIEQGNIDIAINNNPIEKYGLSIVYDQAIGIDTHAKEVTLLSRKRVSYDKLLAATGSRPVVPAVPGINGPGVFSLRTREDAQNIRAIALGAKHAVVLGGGFVGIKAAIALKRLGLTVTIIEKLDRILYEKLDKRGSSIIADVLKRETIDIVTGQWQYEIVRASGTVQSIRLDSGRIIDADFIVAAVGTEANTEAFRNSGIKINKGILVQDSLETNVPDVYAAGDVAEFRDIVSSTYSLSASWANAEEMGRLAGGNMTGAGVGYGSFLSLMNTVKILSVPVTTIGMIDPPTGGYDVFIETGDNSYRKLVFKQDVMVGSLLIGSIEDAGVYPHLIKNRVPLGKLKNLALRGQLGAFNFKDPAVEPDA